MDSDYIAMKWLKDNRKIVIDTPADKNMGVAAMDSTDYDTNSSHRKVNVAISLRKRQDVVVTEIS